MDIVAADIPLLIGLEKLIDGFPDSVGIIGVEVGGSIATDLTKYGNVGHQHRASAAHRLNGGQSESLVERRENEAGSLIVKPNQFFVGHPAQKSDILMLGCIVVLLCEDTMARAYDVELTALDIIESLNETVEILTGIKGRNG